jgi:hypothetical protein
MHSVLDYLVLDTQEIGRSSGKLKSVRIYLRTIIVIIIIIQLNSLLFMCRANSHKANYRQHSVDKSNYIMDKHNIKSKTI